MHTELILPSDLHKRVKTTCTSSKTLPPDYFYRHEHMYMFSCGGTGVWDEVTGVQSVRRKFVCEAEVMWSAESVSDQCWDFKNNNLAEIHGGAQHEQTGGQIKRRRGKSLVVFIQQTWMSREVTGPVANVRYAGGLARFQMRRYVLPLWSSLPHGIMGKLLPMRDQLRNRKQEEVKIWVIFHSAQSMENYV